MAMAIIRMAARHPNRWFNLTDHFLAHPTRSSEIMLATIKRLLEDAPTLQSALQVTISSIFRIRFALDAPVSWDGRNVALSGALPDKLSLPKSPKPTKTRYEHILEDFALKG